MADNKEIYENQMQSGTVATVLGMTKAIGYKGKGKGRAIAHSKVEEEDKQPSSHSRGIEYR